MTIDGPARLDADPRAVNDSGPPGRMQRVSQGPQHRPLPPRDLPLRPRRVRGGEKLATASPGEGSWAAQRWVRLLEQSAPGPNLVEGLEYAKLGQTRTLSVLTGRIDASVQGRAFRAYTTSLSLTPITNEQWERVIEAMAEQAIYTAKLLAGELPPSIEDLFGPLGLRLFPTDSTEVKTKCSCAPSTEWCKHACCVAVLFAQRLAKDPFLMFAVRGLASEELLERLRQRRTIAGATQGGVPIFSPRIPGLSDEQHEPLESCADHFWDMGATIREIDMPVEPPQVSHPLLRRLGPSPFQGAGAKFPLVGLLATCYEMASQRAIDVPRLEPGAPDQAGEAAGPESDPGTEPA